MVEGREYDPVAGNGASRIDTLDGTYSVNSRGGNSSHRHTREFTKMEDLV